LMEAETTLPTVDKVISSWFYKYALVVYTYRWLFLVVPCVMAAVLAAGLYFRPLRTRANSVETFTPTDGPSHYEKAVINDQFPLVQNRFIPGKFFSAKHWIQLVIRPKDGKTVLRPEILNATSQLNELIMDRLQIFSTSRNQTIGYRDLCLTWFGSCYDNGHIELFKQREGISKYVDITYPVARSVDSPLYLGTLIAGVRVIDDDGHFDYATVIRLSYNLKEWPASVDQDSSAWKWKLQRYISNEYSSPEIEAVIWHGGSINEGLKENVDIVLPNFGFSYLVLTIFCSLTNVMLKAENGVYKIDWIKSKPLVGILGVVSAALAVVISLGFLLIVGLEYVLINSVMPILVETDDTLPTEKRLAQALADAGVAITITSVTDVVSFLVGAWSTFPAVTSFCIYTALAMTLDYTCQITFFAAVMAFFGNFEAERRHCLFPWIIIKESNNSTVKSSDDVHMTENSGKVLFAENVANVAAASSHGGQNCTACHCELKGKTKIPLDKRCSKAESVSSTIFQKYYGQCLFHPFVKVAVCFLYLIYIGLAIWGCIVIREGLRPADLVHKDHYVTKFYRLSRDFRNCGMQVHIVVNNPPDLSVTENRQRVLDMVHAFEDSAFTMGSNGTVFFLNEYLNYLNSLGAAILDTDKFWSDDLVNWILFNGARPLWETDIVWSQPLNSGSSRGRIKAFRFQIGLLRFNTAAEQVKAAKFLRTTAAKYADMNVTTYHEFWPHVDQYMSIAPTTWRNLGISFCSMIVIAFILIPNLYCGLFITLSMLSINVGVYGYMSHWDVNLDCISMITLIMSIGFAVDLSAHISYGYICAKGSTSQRAIRSLQLLGYPVLLSGLATVLGVSVLSRVPVPMIVTFFKTVFLVIMLGILHSHMFLPVSLTIFLPNTVKSNHSARLFSFVKDNFTKIFHKSAQLKSNHFFKNGLANTSNSRKNDIATTNMKLIMKLTVCFGAVRIVVPVINNDMLIKDLIDESVYRYDLLNETCRPCCCCLRCRLMLQMTGGGHSVVLKRHATANFNSPQTTTTPDQSWVYVHNLKSCTDGGIFDRDDKVVAVTDDREQILAIYEEETRPNLSHLDAPIVQATDICCNSRLSSPEGCGQWTQQQSDLLNADELSSFNVDAGSGRTPAATFQHNSPERFSRGQGSNSAVGTTVEEHPSTVNAVQVKLRNGSLVSVHSNLSDVTSKIWKWDKEIANNKAIQQQQQQQQQQPSVVEADLNCQRAPVCTAKDAWKSNQPDISNKNDELCRETSKFVRNAARKSRLTEEWLEIAAQASEDWWKNRESQNCDLIQQACSSSSCNGDRNDNDSNVDSSELLTICPLEYGWNFDDYELKGRYRDNGKLVSLLVIRKKGSASEIVDEQFIQNGDEIVEINDCSVASFTYDEASRFLKTMSNDQCLRLKVRRELDKESRQQQQQQQSLPLANNDKGAWNNNFSTSDVTTPVGDVVEFDETKNDCSPILEGKLATTTMSALQKGNTRKLGARIEIDLLKDCGSLGFTVTSRDFASSEGADSPIYVKNILPSGAAVKDGRLRAGDRLLEVNGQPVSGLTQQQVVSMLRSVKHGEVVRLLVSRQEQQQPTTSKTNVAVSSKNDNHPTSDGMKLTPTDDSGGRDSSSGQEEVAKRFLQFDVALNETGSAGLGVSVKGRVSARQDASGHERRDLGIFIKSIMHGGAAFKDGRLRVDDQLVAVDDVVLSGLGNQAAIERLRAAMRAVSPHAKTIRLSVLRCGRPKLNNDNDNDKQTTAACSSGDEPAQLDRRQGGAGSSGAHPSTSFASCSSAYFTNGQPDLDNDDDVLVIVEDDAHCWSTSVNSSKLAPVTGCGGDSFTEGPKVEQEIESESFVRDAPIRQSMSEKRHRAGRQLDLAGGGSQLYTRVKHDRQSSAPADGRKLPLARPASSLSPTTAMTGAAAALPLVDKSNINAASVLMAKKRLSVSLDNFNASSYSASTSSCTREVAVDAKSDYLGDSSSRCHLASRQHILQSPPTQSSHKVKRANAAASNKARPSESFRAAIDRSTECIAAVHGIGSELQSPVCRSAQAVQSSSSADQHHSPSSSAGVKGTKCRRKGAVNNSLSSLKNFLRWGSVGKSKITTVAKGNNTAAASLTIATTSTTTTTPTLHSDAGVELGNEKILQAQDGQRRIRKHYENLLSKQANGALGCSKPLRCSPTLNTGGAFCPLSTVDKATSTVQRFGREMPTNSATFTTSELYTAIDRSKLRTSSGLGAFRPVASPNPQHFSSSGRFDPAGTVRPFESGIGRGSVKMNHHRPPVIPPPDYDHYLRRKSLDSKARRRYRPISDYHELKAQESSFGCCEERLINNNGDDAISVYINGYVTRFFTNLVQYINQDN
ncbi:Patched domain-containing protein 3, partial [Trichinella pseudospiralis]